MATGISDNMIMMYVIHDALRRDLEQLTRAAENGAAFDPARRQAFHAGWELFKAQLHHHHTGEDIALWPRVRTHLEGRPDDLALLDVMEAEHVRIGPTIEDIDAAVADNGSGPARLAEATAEFFPYILTGADPELSAEAVGIFPPPLRMLIRRVWQPRYSRRQLWS